MRIRDKMTPKEVASELGISAAYVRRLIREGEIPSHQRRDGCQHQISRRELEKAGILPPSRKPCGVAKMGIRRIAAG